MEWYYAEGGEQRGPVSEEEFQRLIEAGTVKPDSLVWHQGMADWQRYAEVSGSGAAESEAGGQGARGGLICSQCGRGFPPEEVIRYGEAWVCGECKPMMLQRMREGGVALAASGGAASVEELLARDYEVNVGDYLNRSWEIFRSNVGMILGASVLVYLALFAINIIPYLSMVLSLVLTGPLMGGLWLFYIKCVRGEETVVGDAFGGFGPRFGQLVLANVVTGILSMLCLLPAMFVFVGAMMVGNASQGGGSVEMVGGVVWVLFGILMLIGFAGYLYLAISWLFVLPLVADKGMRFWPAMTFGRRVVGKHWWATLWLAFVVWLLACLGMLMCGVGILITGPVAMGMVTLHYQRVFGDLRAEVD